MTDRPRLLIGLLVFGLVIGLVFVAGVGWWWYSRPHLPPLKIVLQGSSSAHGNLGVSGGNLVVVVPQPGVFFGTVKKPGGEQEFTYLILFRYDVPRREGSNQGIQFDCTSDGRVAETKNGIELDGKRIEVAYRIELSETLTAVANESLTIGGKSMDIASGRAFLIDLTAETPTCQQKEVELPSLPSKVESTEDLERLAEEIRTSLESQDPEIKTFLRQI